MTKPKWAIEKEQKKRAEAARTFWLFGLHAVREALENPARKKYRLIVTPNALRRIEEAVQSSDLTPEITDPRRFTAPIDPESVHQGAAIEVSPLDWGPLADVALGGSGAPLVLLLDRVTDPHNVGAILRSAEVFGVGAVVAPARHAAPETGALAKTASGALERQPYVRVPNLVRAIGTLRDMGFVVIGLDGTADETIDDALVPLADRPTALVLGAEGPGLREGTKAACDSLARIPFSGSFGSLNVSNAAAISLYAARASKGTG